jgi:hypothetical protein
MADMSNSRIGWSELRREAGDPRPPGPLVIGIAFVAQLGWAEASATWAMSPLSTAIGTVVIAAVAAWWLTVPASLILAVVSFLAVDGFAQNQLGQLGWDGNHDAMLLLALLTFGAIAASIHAEMIDESRRRADATRATSHHA